MTFRRALLAFIACLFLLPSAAGASNSQEALFQDDNLLIYTDDATRNANLDTLASLGVDRVRVTVLWAAIAPEPRSRTKPDFDAADPASYADGIWRNYDELIKEAQKRGIAVNLNVTGAGPEWANQPAPRPDIADTFEPSAREFNSFVTAVGKRYDGTYPDPAGGSLPRVDYWSIWNEPNHSGWLTPTWQRSGNTWYERSAVLYRELFGQAWSALAATGHGKDTILLGETAPSGTASKNIKRAMTPLTFVRALYCVDKRERRLRGRRAALLGCGKSATEFKRANPGLYAATGFAHHPYQLLLPPAATPKDSTIVTIGVLGRLTRTLDRTMRTYKSRTRYPLYLTEFGYQTTPDRFGVPLRYQGLFLNQSEYIAARNRRVRAMSQFLLNDDGEPVNKTFQSGLRDNGGAPKPALAAYRLPIWISGKRVKRRVWGVIRPAAAGNAVRAQIQFKRAGRGGWKTVKTVRARGRRHVFTATVRVRARGDMRVRWGRLVSRTERVAPPPRPRRR